MGLAEKIITPEFPLLGNICAHSKEGEEGVLGCLLLDPSRLDECASQISSEDFYDLRHASLYDAMLRLRDEQKPIDPLALMAEERLAVENLGGLQGLEYFRNAVPSAINLPYYIGLVEEKARARRLLQAAHKMISTLGSDTSEEAVNSCEERFHELFHSHDSPKTGGEVGIKEAVLGAIDSMEALVNSDGSVIGLPTGFPALDRMTTGMRDGDYWVLAARPSVGKTALAMNICEHMAVEHDIPVGVLSMEMTAASLAERMVSGRARVNTRYITKRDMGALVKAAAVIANAPIFIDQTPSLSATDMRARARRMHSTHGIRMLAVDYLQLAHANADSRVQEVSKISSTLKAIAKELGIPVLCLSQLNRGVEQREAGKPRLSDLRDSGAIEQDADLVALLHRPSSDNAMPIKMELNVAKQRNGPVGVVELDFYPDETRFTPHLPSRNEMD